APQSAVTDVYAVDSWSILADVTRIQRNMAFISAMMRWNQQSESGISFVYRGTIPENEYQSNECKYNALITIDTCSNGRALTRIKGACSGKKWAIAVCDKTLDDNGVPRSNNYHVGKVTSGSDLLS